MSCHFKHRVFGLPRGSVAVEFALLVPVVLILAFAVIDFGKFVWTRQVLTEVSRLGGGLVFCRDEKYGYIDIEDDQKREYLLNLLEDAGRSIFKDDNKDKWRIVVSKIKAAQKVGDSPTIIPSPGDRGSLEVSSSIDDDYEYLGLSQALHGHLDYTTAQDPPNKSELGVVEVFYKYVPITPLPNFIEGILQMDNGGVIIKNSKAFF